MRIRATALVLCFLVSVSTLPAAESVDLDMVTKIRQEGFRHSRVMDTASDLMDGIGPRLTGSPNMKAANEWTRDKLKEWGLSNAHLESWGPFGRGWVYESCSVRMVSPDVAQLIALPQAWTGGTNGPVRGFAIRVNAATKEEIEKFKGELAGKVVIYGESREIKVSDKPLSERYDDKKLEEYAEYKIPGTTPSRYGPNFREEYMKRRELRRIADKLFADEKVLAVVTEGAHDGGTLSVQSGGSHKKGDPQGVPNLVMDAEHFGRIARLLEKKKAVQLEVDVKVRFIEENQMQWNTIAEIPGTDKKDEVVMLGAHLDSWHGGTGATDNGAGCVVAMEAVRILQALGVKPKRTIRIGLWSGEEQGLMGSRALRRGSTSARGPSRPPAPGAPEMPVVPAPADRAADAQARAGEALGVLQPRQRHRKNPRRLRAGKRGRRSDLPGLARALQGPRRHDRHAQQHRRHRPPVVRRGGAAGIPVHPGRDRVRNPHPSHEHGRLRAPAEG